MNNLPDFVLKQIVTHKMDDYQNTDFLDDDALYLITTGTGAPMADANRCGAQTIAIAGDTVLVFDAGPGSTRQLELTGVSASAIHTAFLTHYHSDHIGDIGELTLKRWASEGVDSRLQIYGPPGIHEVVNGFNAAYTLDTVYRIAHHGEEAMPPSGSGATSIEFDLGKDLESSQVVYDKDGVKVIAFNVDHAPVFPAVGYRVEYKGRSAVITGDTVYTESLTQHTMGADVLISEALNHKFADMIAENGTDANNASVVATDIQTYHIKPEEAGLVARDAGVDQLVITHILPPLTSDLLVKSFLEGTKDVYKGDVYIANDGTLIKLPVNSDKIGISELLK
jgi:ribonuclease Z